MTVIKRINWSAIAVVSFCLLAWSVGLVATAKTARLYSHHSTAGIAHDLVEHARTRWAAMKKATAPAVALVSAIDRT